MSRYFITGVINQKTKPPVGFIPPGPEMITTWDTTKAGSSESNEIDLPLAGQRNYSFPLTTGFVTIPASDYDFWVDWGDGAGYSTHITSHNDSEKKHTYSTGGIKEVKIKGQFGSFHFNDGGDKLKLLDISQFDGMVFDNCIQAFKGCANLNFSATDAPILKLNKSTIMDEMFLEATSFNSNIGHWNVSAATSMYLMFGAWVFFTPETIFNNGGDPSIGNWDVSNVTNISRMFRGNNAFNQDIGNWDVSNVEFFNSMFENNPAFNNGGSPSISGWTTTNGTDMENMFRVTNFNQDIGNWDVSNVTNMSGMFAATSFNHDITGWDVGNVEDMSSMFWNNSVFNQDIGAWDVSNVENFNSMFSLSSNFNNGGSPNISGWTLTNAKTMNSMFNGAHNFNQDIGAWDISGVETMNSMFNGASSFNNGGSPSISGWTTSNLTSMSWLFRSSSFNQDINAWDVSNVTTFSRMFQSTPFNYPITGWTFNTSPSVNINLSYMFANTNQFNQDIGNWDVSRVNNMSFMFQQTTNFNNGGSPSISGWTTSNVTNMSYMFDVGRAFNQPIGGWDVSNVTNMYRMFRRGAVGQPFAFNGGKIYDWQPKSLASGASTGLAEFYSLSNQILPLETYDSLLINWEALGNDLPNNITAHFGGSLHTEGGDAEAAKNALLAKGWTIIDGML